MPWWGWMIFGAFLFGSELMLVDAGFYLVFIGLAAVITGFIGLLGLGLEPWVQWLIFAAVSLLSMVLFRGKLYNKLKSTRVGYKIGPVGESITLLEDLGPGDKCRLNYRGSTWTVLNKGADALSKGTHVQISKVDGLTLEVNSTNPNTN